MLSPFATVSDAARLAARTLGRATPLRTHPAMGQRRAESLGPEHRLRTSLDYAAVKREGRALRGRHCLLLAAGRPNEPTKIGFIASKKGVGGAVQRNRARRRLREIVRRRWPDMAEAGHWLAFVAYGSSIRAPHSELVADVERLLREAGALPRERTE